MAIEKYRITSPTLAFILENEVHVAHTLTVDAIVTIERNAHEKLGKVMWDGKEALMFGLDLASRAEKIE